MNWKSKWNYQAEFIGEVPDDLIEYFKDAQIQESYEVNKLSFTKFEEEAINRVINFFNYVFLKFGFLDLEISSKQIIIIEESEFIEKIAKSRGLCKFGYVYLSRDQKNWRFLRSLVHEIAHLCSFYSLEIKEKNSSILIDLKKTGFYQKEKNHYYYQALNEAATEFFADIIMHYILSTDLLSSEERNQLASFTNYLPEKTFFEELFNSSQNSVKLWNSFFKSYIDGKNTFLNELEESFPNTCLDLDIKKLKVNEEEKIRRIAKKIDNNLLMKINQKLDQYEVAT